MEPRQACPSWKFSCPPHSPPVRAPLAPAGWHITCAHQGKGLLHGPRGCGGRRAHVAGDAHLLWAVWRGRAEPGIPPTPSQRLPDVRGHKPYLRESQQNGRPCLLPTKDKLRSDTAPAPVGRPCRFPQEGGFLQWLHMKRKLKLGTQRPGAGEAGGVDKGQNTLRLSAPLAVDPRAPESGFFICQGSSAAPPRSHLRRGAKRLPLL